jgi:hypothetical protein
VCLPGSARSNVSPHGRIVGSPSSRTNLVLHKRQMNPHGGNVVSTQIPVGFTDAGAGSGVVSCSCILDTHPNPHGGSQITFGRTEKVVQRPPRMATLKTAPRVPISRTASRRTEILGGVGCKAACPTIRSPQRPAALFCPSGTSTTGAMPLQVLPTSRAAHRHTP